MEKLPPDDPRRIKQLASRFLEEKRKKRIMQVKDEIYRSPFLYMSFDLSTPWPEQIDEQHYYFSFIGMFAVLKTISKEVSYVTRKFNILSEDTGRYAETLLTPLDKLTIPEDVISRSRIFRYIDNIDEFQEVSKLYASDSWPVIVLARGFLGDLRTIHFKDQTTRKEIIKLYVITGLSPMSALRVIQKETALVTSQQN